MSRSYHVTEKARKRDQWMNRDSDNSLPNELSELDELSLKKTAAKETEAWRRDTNKAGGLRHHVFKFTSNGWKFFFQKCRGILSDTNQNSQ